MISVFVCSYMLYAVVWLSNLYGTIGGEISVYTLYIQWYSTCMNICVAVHPVSGAGFAVGLFGSQNPVQWRAVLSSRD